jgi:membrane protease YdiL (CAAX protease family)
MAAEKKIKLARVWWSFIIPPLLLAVLTMGLATYIGIKTQGQSEAINQSILNSLPYILMVNHSILFLILLAFLKADGITLGSIGWQLPLGKKSLLSEPLIGVGAGIVLGLFGYFILEPLLEIVQHSIGDYQESAYIVGNRIPWLIGATIFAGVVEESIYRGYAIRRLSVRMGTLWAVIISSLFFGPLHWGQGLWGMVNVVVFGFLFAGIFLWRRNLVAPAFAHALSNVVLLIL